MIPVLDVFAGPGGLGEGFSANTDGSGKRRFNLAISIEKDARAHETLRLRALTRAFNGKLPEKFVQEVATGRPSWERLVSAFPQEARVAEAEALCLELGRGSVSTVRSIVEQRIRIDDAWVLIGGPPCQAYSLVGRARNKGVSGYVAELDHRQTLYVEYLQIVADHAPPVFVMENVKGILSARLESQLLFQRILEDLSDPARALRREGRKSPGPKPRYSIHAISGALAEADDPTNFVIRSEQFGVPQRRHRVILVGVRSDIERPLPSLKAAAAEVDVAEALDGLPYLRSGLSKVSDSDERWLSTVRGFAQRAWLAQTDKAVKSFAQSLLKQIAVPSCSRGAESLTYLRSRVFNHSSRSHIVPDLERYFFASAFAKVHGRSPLLADFPRQLLPKHGNVKSALGSGLFADRFRVQVANTPSTTVTSHIAKDGHYYIHPDPSQCRSLTVREAARLQTFPDDYFFCGPRTSQYQQVGNAVPPRLARQIADCVATVLGK